MSDDFSGRLDQLVSRIALSYKLERNIVPLGVGTLPNRDSIIEITKQLRQLLFPGYFGKKDFDSDAKTYHIGELLGGVFEKLTEQISFALKHQLSRQDRFEEEDISAKSAEICLQFLSSIPKIREYLSLDVQAAFDGDPAAGSKDEVIFSYPGIFAISVHRLAHELFLLSVPLIPRIMSEYAHNITGIDIHPGAEIGRYFFIDHGTGVVIGETTVIHDNVKIYQGVTLGALSTRGGQTLRGVKRHPTLEEGVTVYSGASILGGDTVIGRGVVIGSNAFITKPVPANTRVSIKNPELMFKDHEPQEFKQEFIPDWVI